VVARTGDVGGGLDLAGLHEGQHRLDVDARRLEQRVCQLLVLGGKRRLRLCDVRVARLASWAHWVVRQREVAALARETYLGRDVDVVELDDVSHQREAVGVETR
jgi:hypothetical protein